MNTMHDKLIYIFFFYIIYSFIFALQIYNILFLILILDSEQSDDCIDFLLCILVPI